MGGFTNIIVCMVHSKFQNKYNNISYEREGNKTPYKCVQVVSNSLAPEFITCSISILFLSSNNCVGRACVRFHAKSMNSIFHVAFRAYRIPSMTIFKKIAQNSQSVSQSHTRMCRCRKINKALSIQIYRLP